MRQLLYVSNTISAAPTAMLDDILAASRRRNAACGITGLLLYMDGAFLQVLEGDAEAVEETYARICADRRHWETRVLLEQQTAARAFGQWSMGFQRLAPGGVGADDAFRIGHAAVAAKLAPGAPMELATLLSTFQKVHGGETLSPF
ncbi:MAG TPA: BLUF domain-containing protein [Rhizomicrobium sp.]|jgi:hypothetical protein|nr:BLUF domain-containing protein [Rhizomicrobium sp.]